MPLVQTRGAASAQGFGEFAQVTAVNYIEDVFSTYLYTGNGSTQTITNGIDLAGKGGLVWLKSRSGAENHILTDSARGVAFFLRSDLTNAQDTNSPSLISAFNTTGFGLGVGYAGINGSGESLVSWTFRKQPKFFDIVTYTGDNAGTREIAHNLGSAPGCMIVKSTNNAQDWFVWHRSSPGAGYTLNLNTTAAAYNSSNWGAGRNTPPTSTVFTVGDNANVAGYTYVAYLFAHDAGGFGLTGTDNVISCGSFTTDGSGNATVSLGYEPQWLLVKQSSGGTTYWRIWDTMRGWSVATSGGSTADLYPNDSAAENFGGANVNGGFPIATGFYANGGVFNPSQSHIYIGIRRGPMKVPTLGTSVFGLSARSGTGANATVTGGQTDDAVIIKNRGSAVASLFSSRLTGIGYLVTSDTAAEVAAGATILQTNPWDVMDGVKVGTTSTITNASANTFINYLFQRAPGFFDVVCYTGTGVNPTNVTHNLGVVPELMIVKARSNTGWWVVYPNLNTSYLALQSTGAISTAGFWNSTSPTSSVFTVSDHSFVNGSGITYVAYLFATCAGVSKVGSYTGTGATQTIDCGFGASGSRFVLIKRTDSTGDWYVWDSARGMISGTDPSLLLNSTAAEVNANSVYAISTGFQIVSTAAGINASAGTYIFLSVA